MEENKELKKLNKAEKRKQIKAKKEEKARLKEIENAKKLAAATLAKTEKMERKNDKKSSKSDKKSMKAAKRQELKEKKQEKKIRKQEKAALRMQEAENRRREKYERRQKKLQEKREKNEEKIQSVPYQIRQIAKKQPTHKEQWFKLDNAALIYPALARDSNAQFRLAAVFNEEIDPIILQEAVNDVVLRYPTITSSLKAGLFWWYLDAPTTPLVIEEQDSFPCKPLKLDHRRSMVRVTYFYKEIAMEFFHSATDGSGGMKFFNSLILAYLTRKGYVITDRTNCPHYKDKPRFEELQDCFQIVKNKEKLPPPERVKAMHMKSKPLPQNGLIYYKLTCESEALKTVAKNYGASITQFLTAAVLQSIHLQKTDTQNRDKKPIRISVPINLRKVYNMDTLRNFSSYFYAEYTGGSFAELMESVKKQFAEKTTHEYIQSNINYNTKSQSSPLLRATPLFLKYMVLKGVYHNLGYRQNSASLSNVGVISAPKEFADHIVRYEFSFGRTFCEPIGITVGSFNGLTTIICNSVIEDTQFERHLVKCLVDNGLNVVIESNEGEAKNETL